MPVLNVPINQYRKETLTDTSLPTLGLNPSVVIIALLKLFRNVILSDTSIEYIHVINSMPVLNAPINQHKRQILTDMYAESYRIKALWIRSLFL